MNRKDCIELGYISKAHGLRGEVRVVWDVHDIEEYQRLKGIFLAKGSAPLKPYTIRRMNIQSQKMSILSLEGVNDRNQAEALIGHTLLFPEFNLPELESGHFYYFEVIGYQIIDQNLGELGIVQEFYDGPAQDILAMSYESKEVLIPITEAIVLRADHEKKLVYTCIPEGLIEAYLEE